MPRLPSPGIFADTGNFTHENVRSADFEAAGWLAAQGASVPLIKSFLRTLKEESQITLFHELLNRLSYQTVHGHLVLTLYKEMDRQVGGLAAVVEKVFEVESPDALFAVFAFLRDNETLIIARGQEPGLDVSRILRRVRRRRPRAGLLRPAEGRTGTEDIPRAAGVPEDDACRRGERHRHHGDARVHPAA